MSAATTNPSQPQNEPLFVLHDRVVFTKDVKPNVADNNLDRTVPKGSSATVMSSMRSRGTHWYNLSIQDANEPSTNYSGFHIDEAVLDFHPSQYQP